MILKVFSVYDSKVEAYLQPFFVPTVGAAIRAIMDAMSDPGHTFSKYKQDYTLFQIGEYNDHTGQIEADEAFVNIGNLSQLYQTERGLEE